MTCKKGVEMSTPRDEYNHVFDLLQQHHKWFQESIPLIASENIPSPAVRETMITDFGNRYAEGWPGERVYAGCRFIDQVEFKCIELMKKLFNAEFVDVRPISGVVANLAVYTAFTEPGDTLLALSIPSGGHITSGKKELGGTAGAVKGLVVEYLPLDYKELNIDVDKAKDKIKELAAKGKPPKFVMFGASVFPFPHPVKELVETVHSVGATAGYDAAHVAGLIAGGTFQDPLREGADVVSSEHTQDILRTSTWWNSVLGEERRENKESDVSRHGEQPSSSRSCRADRCLCGNA